MIRGLSDVIVDTVIIAAALIVIYRVARYLIDMITERDGPAQTASDPADAAVWDVLAEARRITEQAGETNATG
jgi:hypothetical protein